MDTKTVTGIVSHPAGYIDNAHRDKETIVGLQTDKPLKRALHVNGGIRIACQAASQHGYKIDENVVERYTFERKTHNAGVFDVYTPEMPAVRPTSSPVCPMAMAAAASSATTVVSPCTVSTT
jgi:formate C-acetyltransferase